MLTVIATGLLLLHMTLADRLADTADQMAFSGSRLHGLRLQIMADAAAAVVLLIVNTVLSIYKPRGMTRYGRRKQRAQYQKGGSEAEAIVELDKDAKAPVWVKVFAIIGFVLLIVFRVVIVHLSGGHGHHFH